MPARGRLVNMNSTFTVVLSGNFLSFIVFTKLLSNKSLCRYYKPQSWFCSSPYPSPLRRILHYIYCCDSVGARSFMMCAVWLGYVMQAVFIQHLPSLPQALLSHSLIPSHLAGSHASLASALIHTCHNISLLSTFALLHSLSSLTVVPTCPTFIFLLIHFNCKP